MSGSNNWVLAVHVVMHEYAPNIDTRHSSNQTNPLVDKLCERLSGNERSPEIPVRLWRWNTEKIALPKRIPLEQANKNLIIFIVDQPFFEAREQWKSYIESTVKEALEREDIVLPISISTNAASTSPAFENINHLVSIEPEKLANDERIFQAIFTVLIRLLNNLPRIFLCHAKAKNNNEESYGEGEKIARDIRKYVYEETQLSCFFDLHDIPHGHGVKQSIQKAISESVVLAVWTDKLLESPWCQFELIETRRQQQPMLVLDALTSKTSRLFPFLGNMPVIRWDNNAPVIVSEILLELLRAYHLQRVFEFLTQAEKQAPKFGLHPPDLLNSTISMDQCESEGEGSAQIFVYPDPPIKANELEVLYATFPSKRFLSLTEWRSLSMANALNPSWDMSLSPRPCPFNSKNIGISVSSSDTWAEMGLISQHQDELSSAIALDLILLGAKVIWGGDLRPEGMGAQLKKIVKTYQHPLRPPQAHVGLFVPFSPNAERRLTTEALQARQHFADVQIFQCPLNTDVKNADDAENIALTALALSIMRAEMAKICHARIILGGGIKKFTGLYPGIAEEAYETIKQGKPLYVLGGFGGAAEAVFETIEDIGNGRKILAEVCSQVGVGAIQQAINKHQDMINEIQRPELSFNPDKMLNTFSNMGIEGLSKRNGLNVEENRRLAVSQNMYEILGLLVKGICSFQ